LEFRSKPESINVLAFTPGRLSNIGTSGRIGDALAARRLIWRSLKGRRTLPLARQPRRPTESLKESDPLLKLRLHNLVPKRSSKRCAPPKDRLCEAIQRSFFVFFFFFLFFSFFFLVFCFFCFFFFFFFFTQPLEWPSTETAPHYFLTRGGRLSHQTLSAVRRSKPEKIAILRAAAHKAIDLDALRPLTKIE